MENPSDKTNQDGTGGLKGLHAPEIAFEEIVFGERIGGGCFGNVYRGKCRGKEVAIKRLHKQSLESKMLEDFRKEVSIMTSLHHPNVVLFMGACTEPGKLAIVCEVMEDNLHNLLKRRKNISLLSKVKFAKDTAAGMAWLHGSNPQILHRDLKPANLLVDSNWRVKVCDFGLSQVKLREEKLRDGKSVPGSPYWMAPEVFLGEEVTEKADVYSFGIILWEIITEQDLFPDIESFHSLKRAITRENRRPEIPLNTHESLKSLMQSCWDRDPEKRPTFTEILQTIDSVLVDCLIEDRVGNEFWKNKFPSQEYAAWSDFKYEFAKLLGIPLKYDDKSDDIKWRCLKKILAEKAMGPTYKDEYTVSLSKFARICNWFGPINLDANTNMLEQIHELMQKEWFHGDIERRTSEELLTNYNNPGTFLVRISFADPREPFTISKVDEQKAIIHQRILKDKDGSLRVKVTVEKEQAFLIQSDGNLSEFIDGKLAGPLHLKKPCPGSKYRHLFISLSVGSYLSGSNDFPKSANIGP